MLERISHPQWFVILPLMPLGVDHETKVEVYNWDQVVILPLMPLGVDHNNFDYNLFFLLV